MKFYTYIRQVGNDILHRYVDEDGNRHVECTPFKPTLYVVRPEDSPYKTLKGDNAHPVEFESMYEANNYRKKFDEVHGNQNYWAQFIREQYPDDIEWDLDKIIIANVDIECFIDDPAAPGGNPLLSPIDAVNAITAITLNVDDKYFVFGSKPYTWDDIPLNAIYSYCETEEELLTKFLDKWMEINPDIVTGWNIDYFDIPYLVGRIGQILGGGDVTKLSPACRDIIKQPVTVRSHREGNGVDVYIMGVVSFDYLKMYKTFTFKLQERYTLDHIAYVELKRKKLDYSEVGNLDDLYHNNYKKYIDYNVVDTELVRKIDDKKQLIEQALTLVYMTKIQHGDVFGQIKFWDTIIYNELMDNNIVVPPQVYTEKSEKYEGAYVLEPVVGMHDWIASFDLDSMYPHLMMQYNISPETLINVDFLESSTNPAAKELLKHWDTENKVIKVDIEDLINGNSKFTPLLNAMNLSMAANGALFTNEYYGILPKLVDKFYDMRIGKKKGMLDAYSEIERLKNELKRRDEQFEDVP